LKFKRSFEAKIWRRGNALFLAFVGERNMRHFGASGNGDAGVRSLRGPPKAPTTKLG
jgi:hypothetical protein